MTKLARYELLAALQRLVEWMFSPLVLRLWLKDDR